MNYPVIILMITLSLESLSAQNNQLRPDAQVLKHNEYADTSVLNIYRQYSSTTDPGEFAYLYKNLPDSLLPLCRLIKSQFVHPYAELPKYRTLFPKERWSEMQHYCSVQTMLAGLVSYDTAGLTKERQLKDKLILACWHNSVLLASILKSRGIPARVRYGHATYIAPGYHISHVINEVWNQGEKRWILVDPSMDMVDFSRDKFDFSNDAWLQLQRNEIDPNLFGIPGRYAGTGSIAAKVCGDLASILGTEYTIFQYAPILDFIFEEDKQLSAEHIELLNRISELMKSLDTENLAKLQEIYDTTPGIQITKSYRFLE